MAPLPAAARLTLGTVQFGLDYGIANRTGRPGFGTVCEILHACAAAGVTMLDAAAGYGDVEEILGRALHETGLGGTLQVTTKLEPLPPDLGRDEAGRRIAAGVHRAMERLRVDQLAICLFHREENIAYADELLALRDAGLVGAAGVSFVTPSAALAALRTPELSVWQIPANLLDRRFTGPGFAARARAAGIRVYARSIYLQGLLLLDDELTPAHLRSFVAPRRRLRELAAEFGLPMAELALRAMLGRPDLDSLVIGSETLPQIEENLELFRKGPLPPAALAALAAFGPEVEERLLDPREWPKAAADAAGRPAFKE